MVAEGVYRDPDCSCTSPAFCFVCRTRLEMATNPIPMAQAGSAKRQLEPSVESMLVESAPTTRVVFAASKDVKELVDQLNGEWNSLLDRMKVVEDRTGNLDKANGDTGLTVQKLKDEWAQYEKQEKEKYDKVRDEANRLDELNARLRDDATTTGKLLEEKVGKLERIVEGMQGDGNHNADQQAAIIDQMKATANAYSEMNISSGSRETCCFELCPGFVARQPATSSSSR